MQKHLATAEDNNEQHCTFQCRHIQSTHVFVPLVLDIVDTGGCEQFLSPSFVPLSSNSQSSSYSKWPRWQRDNSHPLCSQSILPLPRPTPPVRLKWQPCYSCCFSCPQTSLPVPCSRLTSNMPCSEQKTLSSKYVYWSRALCTKYTPCFDQAGN